MAKRRPVEKIPSTHVGTAPLHLALGKHILCWEPISVNGGSHV